MPVFKGRYEKSSVIIQPGVRAIAGKSGPLFSSLQDPVNHRRGKDDGDEDDAGKQVDDDCQKDTDNQYQQGDCVGFLLNIHDSDW